MEEKQDFVWPDYTTESNLYSVSCGLAEFFGVKRQCIGKSFEITGRRLVLIYLDALSWDLFVESGVKVSGSVTRATTVFPSTTAAALSTLMTAQSPGEHGLVGYTVFNKRLGGVINGIKYSYMAESGSGTIDYMPLQRAFPVKPWLAESSAKVLALMSSGAASGELTRTYLNTRPQEGLTKIKSHSNSFEMVASLREALEGEPYDLIYVYYDNPDHIGHGYGFRSQHRDLILEELRLTLTHLDELAQKYKDRYTFLLLSDHGQVTVNNVYVFNNDEELLKVLEVPPYGDSRAVWFRTRENIRDMLKSKYKLEVMSKQEVIESGILGRVDGFVADNILGDYLGVATDPASKYHYSYRDDDPALRLRGNHSGMTPEEMYIPLVVWQ
ncbi:type I phosphodiesterase/nucleotide pyrophosphatase [Acidilobus saccharovorans 345-15]|uniref:Type I phosphodiesterase/nucleotide pyrophosphatase n=1 Tax=Acidilobus saccharovorans (strain DSM 16705 / JCM 18335 / VKM B-2471 / 345-15) TaxID=666510 RepID=D9Q0N7_ACIS3|nr:alkaline phosphatase family protein [Acidilobus saccharovorans]ADL18875.1 type I phosphodiesterase/nucleotide pyrophosphatase [Acidilobus saccharovorans 345-15]